MTLVETPMTVAAQSPGARTGARVLVVDVDTADRAIQSLPRDDLPDLLRPRSGEEALRIAEPGSSST